MTAARETDPGHRHRGQVTGRGPLRRVEASSGAPETAVAGRDDGDQMSTCLAPDRSVTGLAKVA